GETLVLDGDRLLFGEDALSLRLDQRDLAAGREHVGAAGKGARPDLGAAQVLERGDRLLAIGGCLAQALEALRMLGVAAMRKIQARHIHARVDETFESLARVA